jgi:genome maintenance exonuclease 1
MSLITPKFLYQDIHRTELNGKRVYVCPDGYRVPSVTTILSATRSDEKTQSLANWRKRVGDKVADHIMKEASNRGTKMHKFLEDYITIGALEDPGALPSDKQSHKMATMIIDNGLCNINVIYGVEVGLYYPGLYAGTTDGVGEHLHEGCIFDHKQSNKPKKREYIDDYMLQLAAYIIAHDKVYGTSLKKGVILMCTADYVYQEFILENDELSAYKEKWWTRLEQYYTNQLNMENQLQGHIG